MMPTDQTSFSSNVTKSLKAAQVFLCADLNSGMFTMCFDIDRFQRMFVFDLLIFSLQR